LSFEENKKREQWIFSSLIIAYDSNPNLNIFWFNQSYDSNPNLRIKQHPVQIHTR